MATASIIWRAAAPTYGNGPPAWEAWRWIAWRAKSVSAREIVEKRESRDLLRGFTYTWLLLAASVWIVSLVLLVYLAHRISQPIQQLTAGLSQFAAGDLTTRVEARNDDETGRAIRAFNDMAERLQRSTERMVYLTQMASWRTLARKMAHEVKNSLTPIRLDRGRNAGALRRPGPTRSWSKPRRSWWKRWRAWNAVFARFRNSPPSLRCCPCRWI